MWFVLGYSWTGCGAMIKRVVAVIAGVVLVISWVAWLRVLGGYESFTGAFLDTAGAVSMLIVPVAGIFLIVYGLWGDDS